MCKTRVLDVKKWPKTVENEEIDALARVLGCQKRAPRGPKTRIRALARGFGRKMGIFGVPGGRKEHFYHVFKQVLQKAQNRENRPKSHPTGVTAETGETAVCRVLGDITHESGPPRGGPIGGDPLRRGLPQPRYPIVRWGRRIHVFHVLFVRVFRCYSLYFLFFSGLVFRTMMLLMLLAL